MSSASMSSEDKMRHVTPAGRALISSAMAAIAAGLCTLNGFDTPATIVVATLFFVLFWTWLRR